MAVVGLLAALIVTGYFLALVYSQSWRIDNILIPVNFGYWGGKCERDCPRKDAEFKAIAENYFRRFQEHPDEVPIDYREELTSYEDWLLQVIDNPVLHNDPDRFFNLDAPEAEPDPNLKPGERFPARHRHYIYQKYHYCHHKSLDELQSNTFANLVCYYGRFRKSRTLIITLLSGVVISIVNFVIMKLVPFGLSFIPFASRSAQISWEVVLGVLALYTNNIVIIAFVYTPQFAKLFGAEERGPGKLKAFGNIVAFYDLNRDWFRLVGVQLKVLMLTTVAAWTVFDFVMLRLRVRWNRRLAQSARDQSEVLRILEPPEYEFSAAVSHAVNIVLVGLTFAAGLPAMVLICFMGLLLLFALEKYKLVFCSKFPVVLSKQIVWVMHSFLCLGLVVHLTVAILTFGSNRLFPKHWNTGVKQISMEEWNLSKSSPDFLMSKYNVLTRFSKRAKEHWFLTVLLLLTIVSFALLLPLIGYFIKRKRRQARQSAETPTPRNNIFFASSNPKENAAPSRNYPRRANRHLINYDFRYKDENIFLNSGWPLYEKFLAEMASTDMRKSFVHMDSHSAPTDRQSRNPSIDPQIQN